MSARLIWGQCNAAYVDGYRAGGHDAVAIAAGMTDATVGAAWAEGAARLRAEAERLREDIEQLRRGQTGLVEQTTAFTAAIEAELKYHEFDNRLPTFRIAELVRKFKNGVPFDGQETLQADLNEARALVRSARSKHGQCLFCGWGNEEHAPDCRAAAVLAKGGR